MTNFWVKSDIILCVLAKKILYLFKNKIIYNFMIFVATKNGAVFGSRIPDPGSGIDKNHDPGSGILDRHPGSSTLCKSVASAYNPQEKTFIYKYIKLETHQTLRS
jgi:hypothetical protein